jgi:tRNA pseudouridine55 synthase
MTIELGCGILPVNKAVKSSSFHIVSLLRQRLKIEKIGHAGTLDPFATGVMVMLIGKAYTRLSNQFLDADKEYLATLFLGKTTDTYDVDGTTLTTSDYIPTLSELEQALDNFQGERWQIPPMFSAKKIKGKKLYELARKGQVIERSPVKIHLATTLLEYSYPLIKLKVCCSKGTYIRTLAHDLGHELHCGAFVQELCRIRSGTFLLADCIEQNQILDHSFDLGSHTRSSQ